MLKLGKKHIYVLTLSANHLHEDAAALRIANAICGQQLNWTEPVEGKSNIISAADGIIKVDRVALLKINKLDKIIVSTLKNNFPVQKGQIVAATRIIPLILDVKKIERLENKPDLRSDFGHIDLLVMDIHGIDDEFSFLDGLQSVDTSNQGAFP